MNFKLIGNERVCEMGEDRAKHHNEHTQSIIHDTSYFIRRKIAFDTTMNYIDFPD